MNFKEEKDRMIFRKDNDFGTFYTMGLSKKLEDGNYQNGYIDVRFKKDVKLSNKTKINIKEAWLSFYLKEENGYKTTKPYIFVNDFEVVEEGETPSEYEQIEVDIDELPFD